MLFFIYHEINLFRQTNIALICQHYLKLYYYVYKINNNLKNI